MNKEQIKHITNQHYRELKKHIKTVAGDFNVEDIHQFRVAYKKLRAFLRMISPVAGIPGKIEISKKLKRAYNISGQIRDLQLQQDRIMAAIKKDLKKPLAYLRMLRKEIGKLKPELSEIFLENPVTECKMKTDASVPEEFPLTNFRNFVQKNWNAVYAIIVSGHFSDDNIHTIRKCLKDLFYNLKTYEGVEREILSLSVWKVKDEPYFNKLLDELGSFQDRCASIALLKSWWLNSLNASNLEMLERLKRSWIKDKAGMKLLLVKRLKADLIPERLHSN
ncbi:MAG: CHAD domain-containing protein [Ferruginibacter sp.]